MKSIIAVAAFGVSVSTSAVNTRAPDQCCFSIEARGYAAGPLGQLPDGQIRIGGGHPPSTFCLKDDKMTDNVGRGCIVTGPTSQVQCDEGKAPHPGFHLPDTSGPQNLAFGSTGNTFFACPVNDHGEWNVYVHPAPFQTKCVEITLAINGKCSRVVSNSKITPCGDGMKPSNGTTPGSGRACIKDEGPHIMNATRMSLITTTPTICSNSKSCVRAESHPTSLIEPSVSHMHNETPPKNDVPPCNQKSCNEYKSCPADIHPGAFEFPHLIVPLDKNSPDRAFGNALTGALSANGYCTAFNFDISPSHANKTCSLVWLFPQKHELETSDFDLKGDGHFRVAKLEHPVVENTTWNTKPHDLYPDWEVPAIPGTSQVIVSGPCEAGTRVSYAMCAPADIVSQGFSLWWFQDWNPKPIGLYVRTC